MGRDKQKIVRQTYIHRQTDRQSYRNGEGLTDDTVREGVEIDRQRKKEKEKKQQQNKTKKREKAGGEKERRDRARATVLLPQT